MFIFAQGAAAAIELAKCGETKKNGGKYFKFIAFGKIATHVIDPKFVSVTHADE